MKRTYQKTGLYQKMSNELDGRTTTAKLVKDLTEELTNYLGGKASIAAQILIQRIVYAHVRLSQYENAFIFSAENVELQHYMPLVNSQRRSIEVLTEMAGERKSGMDSEVLDWLKTKSLEELKELKKKIVENTIDVCIAEKLLK